MNRRSFLGIILASASAPALVRYASLMKLRGTPYVVFEDFNLDNLPDVYARSQADAAIYGRVRMQVPLVEMEDIAERKAPVRIPEYEANNTLYDAWSYCYSAPLLRYALPPGTRLERVWMAGQEVSREQYDVSAEGVITFKDTNLTPYGNRIPELAAEVVGKLDKYETMEDKNVYFPS